jgi:hypothetical protein
MSQPTPHHHNPIRPADSPAGDEPNLIDLVPGDPPVPITVWRTARTGTDAGRTVPTRLAARLIAAYTRPGEAVVDLTADHSLTTACRTGQRRHHPAWFTEASSLIIGPATHLIPASTMDTPDGGAVEEPDLSAWFGDDLTDPHLPPIQPAERPPSDASLPGATSLVVACWPLHEADAANRVRLAWLLSACAGLLRRGGCLMLIVDAPAGHTATPQDLSPVVSAAASLGLGYLQHIVAVAADTDGDSFVYYLSDEELLTLAHHTRGEQWQVAHLRVHADLLVFSQALSSASRRRAEGGGRRG